MDSSIEAAADDSSDEYTSSCESGQEDSLGDLATDLLTLNLDETNNLPTSSNQNESRNESAPDNQCSCNSSLCKLELICYKYDLKAVENEKRLATATFKSEIAKVKKQYSHALSRLKKETKKVKDREETINQLTQALDGLNKDLDSMRLAKETAETNLIKMLQELELDAFSYVSELDAVKSQNDESARKYRGYIGGLRKKISRLKGKLEEYE
ncbi:uncharacterized protein LOC107362896 [Tetranychus urticae]|nr:uncharacterized protein LOC107362896 [Tetranychus urticae]